MATDLRQEKGCNRVLRENLRTQLQRFQREPSVKAGRSARLGGTASFDRDWKRSSPHVTSNNADLISSKCR